MFTFIIAIIIIALGLVFTIINFKYTTTISLLFYTFQEIPGVLLLYTGIVIGAAVSIPFLYLYSRKYAHNVLNKSIKQETKRLKQEEKNRKKKSGVLKKPPPISSNTDNKVN